MQATRQQIPKIDYEFDALALDVREDRVERGDVAVNVGEKGDPHIDSVAASALQRKTGFEQFWRSWMTRKSLTLRAMTLSLDSIQLGSSDSQRTRAFYASALQSSDAIRVGDFDESPSGYQGYTVSYIVEQPTEVRTVLQTAEQAGATIVKPAKKMLFGAFSGVFQAPDGSFWKVAAATKKDTGPALDPPKPTEIAALLGVSEPKASKKFYEALGMTTDRDYGNKYIDFAPAAGACRLGLMTVDALAKDSGAEKSTARARNLVLEYHAASREEVDAILRTAESAGGQAVSDTRFTDPDGYVWSVVTN